MKAANGSRLYFNDLELDIDAGVVRGKDGGDISLRPQSLAVLRHLLTNANRVVGKDELLDTVWPGIAVTENSLSQCISEIRKAIGDDKQLVLKTAARRGYRLVLPAEALPGADDSSFATDRKTRPVATRGRRGMALAVSALLAALAAIAMYAWVPSRNLESKNSLSIAVLPFENLSEAKEQAYLANGITDDLTTELARVPGLFVVSRRAADPYRNSALAPANIADKLGVRYLLGGSVQRSGETVRINAQLVDSADVGQIWAKRYDGTFTDIFDLQNDVVAEIVDALQLKLVPGKANLAVSGDTDSSEAFQAYRRALEARRAGTLEGTVAALSHLRQALALDPEFGAAASEMAWLYWDADETRLKALGISWEESVVRRYEALAVASKNPPPGYYQLTADLLVREHRSDEAIALLHKAIPLDPSDSWTYEGLSQALSFNGRAGEAVGFLDTALRVEPGWTDWRRYLAGLAAFGEGRYADAVAVIEPIDMQAPDPWSKFYAMHILVAALAHLDRPVATALERLKEATVGAGEGDPNLLITQQFLIYKHDEDIARLLDGLRKAGVPEIGAKGWDTAHRLDGASAYKLIAGHRWVGRTRRYEIAPYRLTASPDGKVTKMVGTEMFEGHMWLQGDALCIAYPRVLSSCGYVYRSPGGRAVHQNEYRFITGSNDYEFSVTQ